MKGVTYTEDGTPLWGGRTEQEILNSFRKKRYEQVNRDSLKRTDGWCWTGKQFKGQRYGIWTASRIEENSPIACTYTLEMFEDCPVSPVYKLREEKIGAEFHWTQFPFIVNFLRDDTIQKRYKNYERDVKAISCLLTHYRSEEKLVRALATTLIEHPIEITPLLQQIAEIQQCTYWEAVPIWGEAMVWQRKYYRAMRGKPEAQRR